MKVGGILGQFVLFLFLMLLMWVGTAYVTQNIQYSSAGKFHSRVVQRLEDSAYAANVIQECQKKAKQQGYQLTIERSKEGKGQDAKVTLGFSYTFPVLQMSREYIIEGYAR
ncbi:MAG: hypothetical protein J1F02_10645 [Lachnospiraceae bacterium]|nr:hypothetical protein [Lachnospiraceae bacterium]